MAEDNRSESRCAECGAALPADLPEDLCPACLLTQALRDQTTLTAGPHDEVQAPGPRPRFRYLGDYELLDEIGRGASGVVYRARQTSLDRTVAVKLLASGVWASAEAVARFHTEAKSAASLKHPLIVAIHEVGEHEGQPYFSMDHIEGHNLEVRLRGGPLPVEQAAEMVRTLAEAVHFAHRQGIVHRDLKPSNVVVDSDLQPHITDFGLAKNLSFEQGLTHTGAVLGTPGYMPPEQADSSATAAADPRGDVYSLGAILYALLVGSPPFKKESPLETVLETVRSLPQPPRRRRPLIPRDLEIVCMRCLEKDPAHRYQTAEELAEDLTCFLGGRPIAGRHGGRLGALSRWARRHRWITAALAAVAVLALVVAVRLLGAQQERFLAQLEQDQQETFESRQSRLEDLLALARERRREGKRWQALELLAQAARIEPTLETRREAIEVAFTPGLRRASSFPAPIFARTSFSADGERLAVIGRNFDTRNWSLEVRATDSGEMLERFDSPPDDQTRTVPIRPHFAVFVDEGTATAARRLKIWNRRRGELLDVDLPADHEGPGQSAAERIWAFSPNGRWLAYWPSSLRRGHGIGVRDLQRGTEELLPLSGTFGGFLDEQRLLYRDRGVLLTWHLDQRKSTSPAPTDPMLAISADRSAAAFRSSSRSIEIWDLRNRRRKARVTTSAADNPSSVRLSPDGRLLALGGGRDPVRVWDLANPSRGARGLHLSGTHELSLKEASFSHDHRMIAVPGGGRDQNMTWVWDIEAAEELACLEGHRSPVWSPTEPLLTTLTIGETRTQNQVTTRPAIALWHVVAPVPTYEIDVGIGSVAFSGDGRRFVVHGELWHGQTRTYTGLANAKRYAAGLPPSLDSKRQVLSLDLGEESGESSDSDAISESGTRIDFRALRPERNTIRLPDFPRTERRTDGGKIRAYPYLWAFEPSGDSMVLASTLLEMDAGKARPNPSAYVLERWDLRAGRAEQAWDHDGLIGAIAISPDGKTTAIGAHQTAGISLRQTDTGELLGRLNHRPLTTVIAFSQDGGKVASAGLSDWLEVTTTRGEDIASWQIESVPRALAFDPAGEILALAGEGPEVSLRRLETGQEIARWGAHDGGIEALAFHPSGRLLVTAGSDGALKAWNLQAAKAELSSLGLAW